MRPVCLSSASIPNGQISVSELIYLVAGETSGDILGARLMAALRKQAPEVLFAGVGGVRMAEQGLDSLFPMDELSLMGLAEVLPHLPRLLGRLRQTADDIARRRPAAVVTIDAPGFNKRLLKRLKPPLPARIHYVAPQHWGWRPSRAKKLPGLFDDMLCLLPFEPAFFEAYGVHGTFVGHPVVEEPPHPPDGAIIRERLGLEGVAPLLAVLPGSRRGEIDKLAPVLEEALGAIVQRHANAQAIVPVVPARAQLVREATASWPLPVTIFEDRPARFDAFAACDLAIHASGTVALELALAHVPCITIYKVNALTAAIVRRLIQVDHANLVNIIEKRVVVPELIQEDCTPQRIADQALALLADPTARERQSAGMARVMRTLGQGDPDTPSDRAAAVVLARMRRANAAQPAQDGSAQQ